jgi:hypothetical protein
MKQMMKLSECNKGSKTCYTTNSKNKSAVEIRTTNDDGSWYIELCSKGQYKIIFGFFYYCTELTCDDGVDNMFYVPSTEKIIYRGDTYYKISNYNIKEYNFENKGDGLFIHNDLGTILNIDILELYELPNKNDDELKINRGLITKYFPCEIYLDFERTSTLDGETDDTFYATSYKEGYKYAKKMINIVQIDFPECKINILNKIHKTDKFVWKSNDFGLIYTCYLRNTILPNIKIDGTDEEIEYHIYYYENENVIGHKCHETEIKRDIKGFFSFLKNEFGVSFKNKNGILKKFNNNELVLLTKDDIEENNKIYDLYVALKKS